MVSIIIPIYNAEKSLPALIECILKQTYQNIEVIFINDGSKDNSYSICKKIVASDSRFSVLNQQNNGVSDARNNGLKKAKGEFITFIDADDKIPDYYIEELMDAQKKTKADIVACDVVMVIKGNESSRFTLEDTVLRNDEALELLLTRRNINSGPCAKLIKTEIIGETVFPKLKVYEDILFVKEIFSKANRIAVTNKTEYMYIQNTESAMHKTSKTPSEDIIVATEELARYIEANKMSDECMYITLSHLFQYVQRMLKDSTSTARDFVKMSRKLYRKYMVNILKCKAFPWKEKVIFVMFCFGIVI